MIFTLILEYLRTGSLNVPAHVLETSVNDELMFWGLAAANQPVRCALAKPACLPTRLMDGTAD